MQEQPTDAAGRDHYPSGRQQHCAGCRCGEHTADFPIDDQQPSCFQSFEHGDRRRRAHRVGQHPHDHPPGTIACRVYDAAPRMCGFQTQAKRTRRVVIEAHTVPEQRFDGGRRRRRDPPRDLDITQYAARRERIGEMQFRVVVRPDCRGDAALGPGARRFRTERCLCQHDGRHGRQSQCGHQTGQAAADDHRRTPDIE